MSNTSNNTSGGIGICGFLFLIFLTLKLAEIGSVATWSWWWVTAPLWGPLVLVIGIFLAVITVAGIIMLFARLLGSKNPARRKRQTWMMR